MNAERKGRVRTQWQDGMGNIQIWDTSSQPKSESKLSFTVEGWVWLTGLLGLIFFMILILCMVAHCNLSNFNRSRKKNIKEKASTTNGSAAKKPALVLATQTEQAGQIKPKPCRKFNKNQELVSLIDSILDTESGMCENFREIESRSAEEGTIISYLSRESIDMSPYEDDGISLSDYSDDVTIYKYFVGGPSSGPGSPQMSERMSSRGGTGSIYFSREESDLTYGSTYLALDCGNDREDQVQENVGQQLNNALSIESLDFNTKEENESKDRPISMDLSLVFDMEGPVPILFK